MGAREAFKWSDVKTIDLVDIDPEITRICRETPSIAKLNDDALADPRLTLYHADAFQFVRDSEKKYDAVVIDLPDPHNEVLNKLYAREFYHVLKRVLKPGGGIVSQCSSPFATKRVYWCIRTSMEAAGYDVTSFHTPVPSFGVWGFHMAAPSTFPLQPRRSLPEDLRYLTSEIVEASQKFPNDIARVETPVNSMLEPVLYQIYNQELR